MPYSPRRYDSFSVSVRTRHPPPSQPSRPDSPPSPTDDFDKGYPPGHFSSNPSQSSTAGGVPPDRSPRRPSTNGSTDNSHHAQTPGERAPGLGFAAWRSSAGAKSQPYVTDEDDSSGDEGTAPGRRISIKESRDGWTSVSRGDVQDEHSDTEGNSADNQTPASMLSEGSDKDGNGARPSVLQRFAELERASEAQKQRTEAMGYALRGSFGAWRAAWQRSQQANSALAARLGSLTDAHNEGKGIDLSSILSDIQTLQQEQASLANKQSSMSEQSAFLASVVGV